ncbi:MAG: glucosamine-6-phosphate deaminase [Candidatus Acetothermia bacterium]
MDILVEQNYESMSQTAARLVAREILLVPDLVLGLATGNTPVGFYSELVKLHEENLLDYSSLKTFNLDEYYPIPPSHPESFTNYMYERFFNHVNVPEQNIYIPDGTVESVEEYCRRYEEWIEESGGLDLQLLGIGKNGHIGYNEPGCSWDSVTRLVELDPRTMEGQSDKFDNPPTQALTMGVKTIMGADQILLLASGAKKAEVVEVALNGPVTTDVPASILQLHPNVTVILDREAAAELDGC